MTSPLELLSYPGAIRELSIERLSVAKAAAEKLRPVRDLGKRVLPFGQEAPKVGVVPAELVSARVAVAADAQTQTLRFGDELIARHAVEVVVHASIRSFRAGHPWRSGASPLRPRRRPCLPKRGALHLSCLVRREIRGSARDGVGAERARHRRLDSP